MADNNNERWRRYVAPFDLPAPSQRPAAPVEDRSWMPRPTVATGGTDWHRDGKWRESWRAPTEWSQRNEPAFHARIVALESELSGLERTCGTHDPRLARPRQELARHYAMLNRLFDAHIKKLPLVRY